MCVCGVCVCVCVYMSMHMSVYVCESVYYGGACLCPRRLEEGTGFPGVDIIVMYHLMN